MGQYKSPFWKAFNSRRELEKYGVDGLLLFALQLRFSIEDIDLVAAASLTEGRDDKKADLVYIDSETGYAIIAQTYMAVKVTGKTGELKKEAPSNKASDLNTAISWLLARPIGEVPENMRPHAEELRQVLSDHKIRSIQLWYVHNLPESTNVKQELRTVEQTTRSHLLANFEDCEDVEIQGIELGISTLEGLYQSISTPILVAEEFMIPIPGGFEIKEANWRAYATSVQASWLYAQFRKHGTDLLSANVREYLGSRNVDRNINNAMKQTANDDPEHFWVFNNGITVLVHSFEEKTMKSGMFLKFTGISVVNGAQTVGAIGSLDSPPNDKAMVQVRFITCDSTDTVYDIVRYNNSQNKIAAPDFRSTDIVQRRLTKEFATIPRINYVARRGGREDIIKRQPDTLPSVTAGQSLAAFHGDPGIAYHEKTHMWEDDHLYSKYFGLQTTAKHILFTYSLLKSVENKKLSLINRSKTADILEVEKAQLDFFRKRGSTFLMSSAVARCLEIILNKPIPNYFNLVFKSNLSPDIAITQWSSIIEAASGFTAPLAEGLADGFRTRGKVEGAIKIFQSLLVSTRETNKEIYLRFAEQVN